MRWPVVKAQLSFAVRVAITNRILLTRFQCYIEGLFAADNEHYCYQHAISAQLQVIINTIQQ